MAISRKSRPREERSRKSSSRQVASNSGAPPVPLEVFLIACQKSLARSVRGAQQSGKADNEFALGERPVYMIESVDLEVSAGIAVVAPTPRAPGESILLDFQAPAELRSRIRFRVQSKPVELMKGAKLELADLDPLGESAPTARMRAWLVDDTGRPVNNHQIELHFARAGEREPKHRIMAVTDSAGRVDFFIEPSTDDVKVVGDRTRKKVFLRGSGRGINPDEYFVWAVAKRKPSWVRLAGPSAPYPPGSSRDPGGLPDLLYSEMHRIRIE